MTLKWGEKWGSKWWGGRSRSNIDWHHFCLKEKPQLTGTSDLNGTCLFQLPSEGTKITLTQDKVMVAFTLRVFQPSLLQNLAISSLQVSLACVVGSKWGSRVQPQVLHLYPLWGSNFQLLPRQEEHDDKLSLEAKEVSLSRAPGSRHSFLHCSENTTL